MFSVIYGDGCRLKRTCFCLLSVIFQRSSLVSWLFQVRFTTAVLTRFLTISQGKQDIIGCELLLHQVHTTVVVRVLFFSGVSSTLC